MGEICILSVGTGDTKLVFDPKNPEDCARAAKTIQDMLRRGYCILVEVAKDDKNEPLYRRVKEFRADTYEYIIAGDPPDIMERASDEQQSSTSTSGEGTAEGGSTRKPRKTTRSIRAYGARGIAIAPIAGG